MRLGYEPVKADDLPGFEHMKVKAGEHVGFVACNEMLLFKIPEEIYQEIMLEQHHYAPLEEAEKIKIQQEQLLDQRDSGGKSLVKIEGSINTNKPRGLPTF
jgi:signal-transduction protein with cAMP-binding, CBS, and nucleotidyltransferase domain